MDSMEIDDHLVLHSDNENYNDSVIDFSSTVPKLPRWFYGRPCLTEDYLSINESFPKNDIDRSSFKTIPIQGQEQVLIDDLLYLMMGIDGQYITFKEDESVPGGISWSIDPNVQSSLTEFINLIMPLCAGYVEVSRFTDNYQVFGSGLVANAVASAISSLLHDYLIYVSQLEFQSIEGSLTLQKLWYYIQGSLDTMNILTGLVRDIQSKNANGGALLNLIYERSLKFAGNKVSKELYNFILQKGSVPYFEMLKQWIYQGTITDPYHEFFVRENRIIGDRENKGYLNEYYWENKFSFFKQNIFFYLESLQDKIYITGKNINAIRECGIDIKNPHIQDLTFDLDERKLKETIDTAYKFSSSKLIHVLMKENKLLDMMKTVKRFFLLEQGDFVLYFLDLIDDELKKSMSDILIPDLQTQMDIAIKFSCANDDAFSEMIRVSLVPYNLIDQILMNIKKQQIHDLNPKGITGLEALTLTWKVSWPSVLIFNQNALNMYQFLFRHLFYIKYTERKLNKSWQQHQLLKRLFLRRKGDLPNQSSVLLRFFSLRHRMIQFIQTIQYYMLVDVIEPEFTKLIESIKKSESVNEIMDHHQYFLEQCNKYCLIDDLNLVKIITKILSVCVIFSNYTERFVAQFTVDNEGITTLKELELIEKIASEEGNKSIEKMSETIAEFEKNFDQSFRSLLEAISSSQDEHMINLHVTLDYNDYYSGIN